MPAKKKVTKKSEALKEVPKKVLRRIDANTVILSDNPSFPEAKTEEEILPKGMKRIDAHTVIKVD